MKKIFKKHQDITAGLIYLSVIGVSIFALFFVITSVWIGYDVKDHCFRAQAKYQKNDCIEALITQLNDEHEGFRERNSAIWTLGQLGDARALPTLQKYYTGDIPNREPLNSVISQYELKKAVALTSGGKNITAIFWRYGIAGLNTQ